MRFFVKRNKLKTKNKMKEIFYSCEVSLLDFAFKPLGTVREVKFYNKYLLISFLCVDITFVTIVASVHI